MAPPAAGRGALPRSAATAGIRLVLETKCDAGSLPNSAAMAAAVVDDDSWRALSPLAAEAAEVSPSNALHWGLHRATWYLRQPNNQCGLAIDRAMQIAAAAHAGQKRKSGEDFIVHPVETACILASLKMDRDTIIAGLLHDTVEDTRVTLDDLRMLFGESVASIVQGESKVSKLYRELEEMPESERRRINQREMLLSMSTDWRIVVVKLADRLHNMRTLQHMPRHKQVRIARETVQIFVPLASRLGIYELERELLQVSIEYLFPREMKGLFGLSLLGHMARLQFWGVLDDVLRHDSVLHEFDVESKLLSHRQRWVEHTNYWAVAFAE